MADFGVISEKERNYIIRDILTIDCEHKIKMQDETEKHWVLIKAAFIPIPIPKKGLIQATIYAATTGAYFDFKPGKPGMNIKIESFTTGNKTKVSSELESTSKGGGMMKAKAKGLGIESSEEETKRSKASFNSWEGSLNGTCRYPSEVHWSFRLPQGVKVYREYLEGNLKMEVVAICPKGNQPKFKVEATSENITLFGRKGELSAQAILALKIKLFFMGQKLPELVTKEWKSIK